MKGGKLAEKIGPLTPDQTIAAEPVPDLSSDSGAADEYQEPLAEQISSSSHSAYRSSPHARSRRDSEWPSKWTSDGGSPEVVPAVYSYPTPRKAPAKPVYTIGVRAGLQSVKGRQGVASQTEDFDERDFLNSDLDALSKVGGYLDISSSDSEDEWELRKLPRTLVHARAVTGRAPIASTVHSHL